jgi:uncharacterized membrane protein YkvA (DUF1232 family)
VSPTEDAGSATTTRRHRRTKRARPAADSSPEAEPTPRTGAKRTVASVIREIPNYLRLLAGLMTDRRVAGIDKLLVAGAIAYIVLPLDFIPDFIPFLGEVDDVFLLVSALQRLIENAGGRVVGQYWLGAPEALEKTNLQRVLMAAAFFLPRRMRRRLRAIGR